MKKKSSAAGSKSKYIDMRGRHRSFNQARAYVRRLKIGSYREWLLYCDGQLKGKGKKPLDIPRNPRDTYDEQGWKGFSDWLGNDNIGYRNHVWRPFPKARNFVRKLKLRSNLEWRAYVRGDMKSKPALPKDIPTNPNYAYAKNQWKGYRDWLGTEAKKKK